MFAAAASLSPVDWAVIAVYLIGIITLGLWLGRGQKTTRDYFLGGRDLPWWGVALSIVATETSALTFIGVPALIFVPVLAWPLWTSFPAVGLLTLPLVAGGLLFWSVTEYLLHRGLFHIAPTNPLSRIIYVYLHGIHHHYPDDHFRLVMVPIVSVIIGEGGSGGAMALAAANTILMQEHAIYSVISPEGCASILWRDSEKNEDAANALKLTADDLLELGVIDKIISEPIGGAHRNKQAAIAAVSAAIGDALKGLSGMDGGDLKTHRREKFLKMGNKGLS